MRHVGLLSIVCVLAASVARAATITNIEPMAGSINGNTRITVTGTGFDIRGRSNDIMIGNGLDATFCDPVPNECSETRIVCLTDKHEPVGAMPLTVRSFGFLATCFDNDGCTFTYTTEKTPVVTGISPEWVTAGSLVTFTGQRFSQGDVTVANFDFSTWLGEEERCELQGQVSWSSFVCLVYSMRPGSLSVDVSMGASGRASILGVSPNILLLPTIDAVSPSVGSVAGGSRVTITGSSFHDQILAENIVTVHGAPCIPVSASTKEIVCITTARDATTTASNPWTLGQAKLELWYDLPGGELVPDWISKANFLQPSQTVMVNSHGLGTYQCIDCAVRLTSYFIAPASGEFTFTMGGDDEWEHWISDSENPVVRKQETPANSSQALDTTPFHSKRMGQGTWSQTSTAKRTLTQGNKYWLRSYVKQARGGMTLVLSVVGPDGKKVDLSGSNIAWRSDWVSPVSITIRRVTAIPSEACLVQGSCNFNYQLDKTPSVSAVTPASAVPGDLITVTGSGFDTTGAKPANPSLCAPVPLCGMGGCACATDALCQQQSDLCTWNVGTGKCDYISNPSCDTWSLNNISFGDSNCFITSQSSTQLICRLGYGMKGTFPVVVAVEGLGFASGFGSLTINTVIRAIFPSSGSINGANSLTMVGRGFDAEAQSMTTVDVGGNNCPVTKIDGGRVICTLPAHAAGATNVVMTTGSRNAVTIPFGFNYGVKDIRPGTTSNKTDPTITPTVASVSGGTLVVITVPTIYISLTSTATVNFGNRRCAVRFALANTIRCETSAVGTPVTLAASITVTHSDGVQETATSPTVRFVNQITWVSTFYASKFGGNYFTVYMDSQSAAASSVELTVNSQKCTSMEYRSSYINCWLPKIAATPVTLPKLDTFTFTGDGNVLTDPLARMDYTVGVVANGDGSVTIPAGAHFLMTKKNIARPFVFRAKVRASKDIVNKVAVPIRIRACVTENSLSTSGYSGVAGYSGDGKFAFGASGLQTTTEVQYKGVFSSVGIDSRQYREYKLEVFNRFVRFYVDNILIGSFEDPNIASGAVGFGFNGQAITVQQFDVDDLKPTALSVSISGARVYNPFDVLYSDGPTMKTMTPNLVSESMTITVTGANFGNSPYDLYAVTASGDEVTSRTPRLCTGELKTNSFTGENFVTCVVAGSIPSGSYFAVLRTGSGQSEKSFAITVKPRVKKVSPSSSGTGGQIITVSGTGFPTNAQAKVGGQACTTLSLSTTSIVCVAPAIASGSQSVTVLVGTESSTCSTCSLNYNQTSGAITGVSPATVSSFQSITIAGSGFGSSATVFVGDTKCYVWSATATEVKCEVQNSIASGPQNVLLTFGSNGRPTGSASVTLAAGISRLSPTKGSVNGGTEVVVYGGSLDTTGGASGLAGIDFSASSATDDGWNIGRGTYSCGSKILYGPFSREETTKTFANLAVHQGVRVSYSGIFEDNDMYAIVDGTWYSLQSGACFGDVCGNSGSTDCKFEGSFVIPHTAPTLVLAFTGRWGGQWGLASYKVELVGSFGHSVSLGGAACAVTFVDNSYIKCTSSAGSGAQSVGATVSGAGLTCAGCTFTYASDATPTITRAAFVGLPGITEANVNVPHLAVSNKITTSYSANGAKVWRSSNRNNWDGGVFGPQAIAKIDNTIVGVQFNVNGVCHQMVGLTRDKYTSDDSYSFIDYAIYFQRGGQAVIYERGQWVQQVSNFVKDDLASVAYNPSCNCIQYSLGGRVVYTSAITPVFPLFVGASIHDAVCGVNNMVFLANRATTRRLVVAGTALTQGWGALSVNGNPCADFYLSNGIASCWMTVANADAIGGSPSISIRNPNGQSSPVNLGLTTLTVSAPQSAKGSTAGGHLLRFIGSGFSGSTAISVANQNCAVTSVSTNEVVCRTAAAGVSSGAVVVTTSGQAHECVTSLNVRSTANAVVGCSSVQYAYDSSATPTVSSIDPAAPVSFSTIVISGTNFPDDVPEVFIGPHPCVVSDSDATTVTCSVGVLAGGQHAVTVRFPAVGLATSTQTVNVAVTISSVSSTAVGHLGGAKLLFKGSGFGTTTDPSGIAVQVNGANICSSATRGDTWLQCEVAAGTWAGGVVITINGVSATSTGVTASAGNAPTVASISPNAGGRGTIITMTGTNLGGDGTLVIGGSVNCAIIGGTSTSATCRIDGGLAASAGNALTITTNNAGAGTATPTFEFRLMVAGVSPARARAGDVVTVLGSGFVVGKMSVLVSGAPCTVTAATVSTVTCTVTTSPTSTNKFDVTASIVDPAVTANTNSPTQYTYDTALTATVSSIAPTSGTATGLLQVTITGTGFSWTMSDNVVTLGSTPCLITSNTDTTIICTPDGTTARGASNVNVLLTNQGRATSATQFTFNFNIDSVSATDVSVEGGARITLTGSGLVAFANGDWQQPKFTVTVGEDRNCAVVSGTATTLVCDLAPAKRPFVKLATLVQSYSMKPDQLDNQIKVSGNGVAATVNAALRINYKQSVTPTVTAVSPTGVVTPGTVLTIDGTGFGSGNTVWAAGSTCTVNTESATRITCTVTGSALGVGVVSVNVPNVGRSSSPVTCPAGQYLMCNGKCLENKNCIKEEWGMTTCPDLTYLIIGDTFCHSNGGTDRVNVPLRTDDKTVFNLNCPMYSCEGGDCDQSLYIGGTGGRVSTCGTDPNGFGIEVRASVSSLSAFGSALGGYRRITVTGQKFGTTTSDVVVKIGQSVCATITLSDTQVVCDTGANLEQDNIDLVVYVKNVAAVCTGNCKFSYTSAETAVIESPTTNADVIAGRTITITGQKFGASASAVKVLFDTAECGSLTLVDATKITCTVPHNPNGLAALRVVRDNIGASMPVTVSYSLRVTGLSSSSGSTAGGSIVTVSGSGFTATTTIAFGTCGSIYGSFTNNQIIVTTVACSGGVSVSATDGKTKGSCAGSCGFNFAASSTPLISGVSVVGNVVTLTMSQLGSIAQADVSVTAGDATCALSSYSSTGLTCNMGSGLGGTYNILARIGALGYAIRSVATDPAAQFTFPLTISSFTPATGSRGGSQTLTVTGTGFTNSAWSKYLTISIGSAVCKIQTATATQLTCLTGRIASATTANVVAAVANPMAASNPSNAQSASTYFYDDSLTPVISSVAPPRGSTAGGTSITIGGTNLAVSTLTVTINGKTCTQTPQQVSDTTASSGSKYFCTTAASASRLEPDPIVATMANGNGAAYTEKTYQYIDLWSAWTTWGNTPPPVAGDSVVISEGQLVLVDYSPPQFFLIIVMGHLKFDDNIDINFDCTYIMVNFGRFTIGTPEKPYRKKAVITLHGDRLTPEIPVHGSKVIALRHGAIDMHGIPRQKTWTLLAATAEASAGSIQVKGPIDWTQGEFIVVGSTDYWYQHSEVRRIVGVTPADGQASTVTVQLECPLIYQHWGVQQCFGDPAVCVDEIAEVGLLTRNIVIRGDRDSMRLGFGGTMFLMPLGETPDKYARLSFVEFAQVGQMFIVGRYPVHFHVTGSSNNSYVNGSSVHESMNRAFSIHGISNNTYVNNVAYDIMGHAFFIEDGSERYNVIENNFVSNVKSSTSNLNTDVTPANFWTVSPTNWIVGNRAGGGDAYGFWISPFHPFATGPTHSKSICPASHPLWKFENNVAHSNRKYGLNIFQFWWPKAKECDFGSDDVQAVIRNHVSYKNQIWGITLGNHEVGEVGSVLFDGAISADNGWIHDDAAAYWIEHIKARNQSTGIQNSVLIAVTNNQPYRRGNSRRGINLPLGDNFFSENITFVNYDNENHGYEPQAWAQRMSLCFPWGWEAVSRGLRWVNSPNRILFRFDHHGILNDDDGTLSNTAGSQTIPAAPIFDPAICANANVRTNYKGYTCPQPYKVRRFGIAKESDIFKDQIWTARERSEVVPQILREYLVTAPVNSTVKLNFNHWKSPEAYNWGFGGPTFTQKWDWMRFQYTHNESRYRVHATFDGKFDVCQKEPEIPEHHPISQCSYNNITGLFSAVIRRPTSTMAVAAFNCPVEGCPRKPRKPGPWDCACKPYSQAASWTKGAVPSSNKNERVEVEEKDCICLDAANMPLATAASRQQSTCKAGSVYPLTFSWFEVNGGVHFRNEHCPCDGAIVHMKISANVWIRDGGIVVGNSTHPLKRCTFRLSVAEPPIGDLAGMEAVKLNPWGYRSVTMEAGMLSLNGAAPEPLLSRLAATVKAGATSITIQHDHNWTVGDVLVVAGTNRNVFLRNPKKYFDPTSDGSEQSEKVTIKSVSGRTIELTTALKFDHFGESNPQVFGANWSFYIGAEVAPLSRKIIIDAGYDSEPPKDSPTYGMGWNLNVGCSPLTREGCSVGTRGEVGWPMTEDKPGYVELNGALFRDIGQETSTFGGLDVDGLTDGIDAYWSFIRNNAFDRAYSSAIFVRSTTSALAIQNNVFFNYSNDAVRVAGYGNLIDGNVAFRQNVPVNCDEVHFIFWDCRPAAFRIRADNMVTNNIAASGPGAGYITEGDVCGRYEKLQWSNNTAHSFRDGMLVHTHISDENMKWNDSGIPDECRHVGGVTTYWISDHGFIAWYADGDMKLENFASINNQIGSAALLLYPPGIENGVTPRAHYTNTLYAGYFNGEQCQGQRDERRYLCKKSLMDGAPWCKLYMLENGAAMGNMGMLETIFTASELGIGKTKGEQKFRWLEMDSYATLAGQAIVDTVHFANFDGSDTCGRKNVGFAQNIFSNDTFHHHTFEKVSWSGITNNGHFYGRRYWGDTGHPADQNTPTWYLDYDNWKYGAYWPDSPHKMVLIDKDGTLTRTNKPGSSVVISETITRPVVFQKMRYDGRGFQAGRLPPADEACTWNNDWNLYSCNSSKEWVNVAIDNLDDDAITRRPGPVVLCKGDGMIERNGDPKCQGLGLDYASGPVMKGKEQRATLDRMTRYRFVAENNGNYTLSFRGMPPAWMRLWLQNTEYLGDKSAGITLNLRYFGLNSALRVGVYVNGTRLRSNVGFGYPWEQKPAMKWPSPTDASGTHYHDKYVSAAENLQRNVLSFVLRPYDVVDLKQEPIVQINAQLSMPVEEFFDNKDTFVAAMASVLGIDESRIKFAKIVPGNPTPSGRGFRAQAATSAVTVDVQKSEATLGNYGVGDLRRVLNSSLEAKANPSTIKGFDVTIQDAKLLTVQYERPSNPVAWGTPYISLNITQSTPAVVNRTNIRELLFNYIRKMVGYNETEMDQYALARVFYDRENDRTEGVILVFHDNSTLGMLALRDIFFPALNSSHDGTEGGVLIGYGVYDVVFHLNGWSLYGPATPDSSLIKFVIGAVIGLFVILCGGGAALFYFIKIKPARMLEAKKAAGDVECEPAFDGTADAEAPAEEQVVTSEQAL